MLGQGRPVWVINFCICLNIFFSHPCQTNSQELLTREAAFPEWFESTRLNDAWFIDADRGFAIGERGLILATSDGGRTWSRKPLALNCSLNSIHFADSMRGWIVGGYEIPNYPSTKGVIFRTLDGGLTWKQMSIHSLPQLRWCHFTTPTEGWAIGDSSPSHPSGILQTSDGGLTWSSYQALPPGKLRTACLQNSKTKEATLSLATFEPGAFEYSNRAITRADFTSASAFPVQCIDMLDDKIGFAVGEAGRIALTRSAGVSWDVLNPLQATPPENFPADIDLNTIETTEDAIWFAGNPGSFVYRFDRDEKTWTRYATGSSGGINRLRFVDSQCGWAVGDHGAILKTENGGASWQAQHGDSPSVAILHIAREARDLSMDFVAKYSIENHLRCAVCIAEPNGRDDRIRQSLSRVGVANVALTNCLDDPKNSKAFDEYLVRLIRQCRPAIVIIDGQDSGFVANVIAATNDSGVENRFPHQLADQALKAWTTPIVLQVAHGQSASNRIATQQFLTRIGRRLDDHLVVSRMLLEQTSDASHLGLTAIRNQTQRDISFSDLTSVFKSLDLVPPTFSNPTPSRANLSMMKACARKSQALESYMQLQQQNINSNLLQNLNQVIAGLDDMSCGVWLHQLSEHYISTGRFELAAEAISYFAQNYSDHPLLYADLAWLWMYYSSDELGNIHIDKLTRAYLRQQNLAADQPNASNARPIRTVQQIETHDGQAKVTWKPVEVAAGAEGDAKTVSFQQVAEQSKQLLYERYMQSQRVAIALERLDFDAFGYPEMKLASLRLDDKSSSTINTTGQWKSLMEVNDFAIARIAKNELDLMNGGSNERERMKSSAIRGQIVDVRPVLDGKLDEHFWNQAFKQPVVTGQLKPNVKIAADNQFIYFALSGSKIANRDYSVPDSPRTLDPDLADSDRIVMRLDIDRDFQSFYELTFDARGLVAESCCGNKDWNPTWYVAQHQTDSEWTIEAAMPIDELLPTAASPVGGAWAISVERFDGSKLIESMSAPESDSPDWPNPGKFVLLLFDSEMESASENE